METEEVVEGVDLEARKGEEEEETA